jgi:DNA (cytosine-5)-methyltransferase 1
VKPRLLDLYCGAGGAARGYQRAGFEVIGVDNVPQPRYAGDAFIRDDAVAHLARHGGDYDAVHASPPCQASSALTRGNRKRTGWSDSHVDLIPVTRALLEHVGAPYVIENVQGSALRRDLTLCGEMFSLAVIRHRYFELGGWTMPAPDHVPHRGRVAGMRHGEWFTGPYFQVYGSGGGKGSVEQWRDAMGIDWTWDRRELAEAIPPAYGEFVGRGLMAALEKLVSPTPETVSVPDLAVPEPGSAGDASGRADVDTSLDSVVAS